MYGSIYIWTRRISLICLIGFLLGSTAFLRGIHQPDSFHRFPMQSKQSIIYITEADVIGQKLAMFFFPAGIVFSGISEWAKKRQAVAEKSKYFL